MKLAYQDSYIIVGGNRISSMMTLYHFYGLYLREPSKKCSHRGHALSGVLTAILASSSSFAFCSSFRILACSLALCLLSNFEDRSLGGRAVYRFFLVPLLLSLIYHEIIKSTRKNELHLDMFIITSGFSWSSGQGFRLRSKRQTSRLA